MRKTIKPVLHSKTACLSLMGVLSFANCKQWEAKFTTLLAEAKTITIDCQRVTNSDSAGVALLVHWIMLAKKQQKEIILEGLPDTLLAIARLGGVDQLLIAQQNK